MDIQIVIVSNCYFIKHYGISIFYCCDSYQQYSIVVSDMEHVNYVISEYYSFGINKN